MRFIRAGETNLLKDSLHIVESSEFYRLFENHSSVSSTLMESSLSETVKYERLRLCWGSAGMQTEMFVCACGRGMCRGCFRYVGAYQLPCCSINLQTEQTGPGATSSFPPVCSRLLFISCAGANWSLCFTEPTFHCRVFGNDAASWNIQKPQTPVFSTVFWSIFYFPTNHLLFRKPLL